ncbi:MAG TPA: heme-binding protein [Acidimicrobiales bacterium]|nr:heme-binding protein [Acidimicrobiales bacterium]
MQINATFSYQPTPPAPTPAPPPTPVPPPPPGPNPGLGLLEGLIGRWAGTGLNVIWRPTQPTAGSDRFLEINVTAETLDFDVIPGDIPNRGLLQADLTMTGLRYLQQVSDSNLNAGLHVEPGLWLNIPATTDPSLPATIARLATIPHGTSILAQGVANPPAAGPPAIPAASITPFPIGNPAALSPFPEQTLSSQSNFRTSGPGLNGVTQDMLNNPNSVLAAAAAGLNIASTVALQVSTDDSTPVLGGGVVNTAFLQGGPGGPNAVAARVTSTFWLQTTQGSDKPDLLQYSQTVLLNFNGITWPHVSVATLRPAPAP